MNAEEGDTKRGGEGESLLTLWSCVRRKVVRCGVDSWGGRVHGPDALLGCRVAGERQETIPDRGAFVEGRRQIGPLTQRAGSEHSDTYLSGSGSCVYNIHSSVSRRADNQSGLRLLAETHQFYLWTLLHIIYPRRSSMSIIVHRSNN